MTGALLVAAGVAALTLCACGPARSVWQLCLAVTATGATNAVFVLARQSYLTEAIAPGLRARALSTLGGMSRIGMFAGPFLGAAVAPPASRSQFLGVWRLCADSGSAGGPLVVSAAAALGSLAAGIATMGALGVAAAAALLRWVPRYSPYATRGTRSRSTVVAGEGARPGPSAGPGGGPADGPPQPSARAGGSCGPGEPPEPGRPR